MGVRLSAEVCPRQPVLHAEHRLASVDEGVEATTFPVLVALLVQREVEVGQQRADLSQVVLQHALSPRRCAWFARNTLKRSWSAPVSANPDRLLYPSKLS